MKQYTDLAEEENEALGQVLGRPAVNAYNPGRLLSLPSTTTATVTSTVTSPTETPTPSTSSTGHNAPTQFQNCTFHNSKF